MNANSAIALAVVILMSSATLARAEVNSVISEVNTARFKAVPGSKGGTTGRNNAPISTSRSNIKHGSYGIATQPGKQPACLPGKRC